MEKKDEAKVVGTQPPMGEMPSGWRLLGKWRCSLWKLVWKEMFSYFLVYFLISVVYRHLLTQPGLEVYKKGFEVVVQWLHDPPTLQLTFILGFYVSLVVKRWWDQYVKLPWPDEVAMFIKAGITKEEGETGENLRIRRTVVRYLVLSYVLCLRRVSTKIRNHCPTMQTLVNSNLLREDEALLVGDEDERVLGEHGGSNWWMPLKWSIARVTKANSEGRVNCAPVYANIVKGIVEFRKSLTGVVTYGYVPVPLVYSQVVHAAVYFYFYAALIGRQPIIREDPPLHGRSSIYQDFVSPFLVIEFLVYFGWLNVASTLYNPFGDDDDDFELLGLINRHIKVCMSIVEDDIEETPKLENDAFWTAPPGASSDWHPTFLKSMKSGETEDTREQPTVVTL